MKFLCLGNNENKIASQLLDKQIKDWYKPHKYAVKILLLGTGESGKTTVLKQMKILHVKGFSEVERKERAEQIRNNIHEAAYVLASQLGPLGFEPKSEAMRASIKLLEIGATPPRFTQEYFDTVQEFWDDEVVKMCLRRSNEFQLIDCAEYFLNKLQIVRDPTYVPNDDDILQSRQMTTGIQKIEFKVKVSNSQDGGMQDFWLFDVGGQRGERSKWIKVFEGIHAIWFLVASSDFDQTLREDNKQNRLRESIAIFESTWQSRFLLEAGLIVFLNKQDVLRRKIEEGRSVSQYFPEYEIFKRSRRDLPNNEYERARLFIQSLLVEKTQKPQTSNRNTPFASSDNLEAGRTRQRECYYHFTVATDTENIKKVFKDIRNVVLRNSLKEMGML